MVMKILRQRNIIFNYYLLLRLLKHEAFIIFTSLKINYRRTPTLLSNDNVNR